MGILLSGIVGAQAASAQTARPTSDDCQTCHAEPSMTRADGRPVVVDPKAFAASIHAPLACVDCHADLAAATEFPHAERLAPVNCAACHDEPAKGFALSAHGAALRLTTVAPTCSECHGSHDIRRRTDLDSRVHPSKVSATCGTCHANQQRLYGESIHAELLQRGAPAAPQCASCHSAHSIRVTASDEWQLAAVEECGTCHREALTTYRDSLHGQVTALGFTPVAKCADCHQSHRVFRTSDARSSVSPANRLATCQTCHASANLSFISYQPHANRDDRGRLPALYYAGRFMDALLYGVFAFFGVHTLLWLVRERAGPSDDKGTPHG